MLAYSDMCEQLQLLYMCPHTTVYAGARSRSTLCVSSCTCAAAVYVSLYQYMCPRIHTCVSSHCYICPRTAIYVSSYCYICVRILLCVFILLYVCMLIIYSSMSSNSTETRDLLHICISHMPLKQEICIYVYMHICSISLVSVACLFSY